MSDHIELTRGTPSGNNPHLSVNTALGEVDSYLSAVLNLTMENSDLQAAGVLAGQFVITLTKEQFLRHAIFIMYDDLVYEPHRIYLLCPDGVPRGSFIIRNMTKFLLQIYAVSQANPLPIEGGIPGGIPAWMPKVDLKSYAQTILSSDGVSVMRAESERYVNCWLEAVPANKRVWMAHMGRYCWLYADSDASSGSMISGCYATCRDAPSGGNVSFDVRVRGASIGSIDFANGSINGEINLAPDGWIEGISDNEAIELISPANVYGIAGVAISIPLIG